MADSPAPSDFGSQTAREAATGTPRWVKVSGVLAIAFVVAFVVLHLTGTVGSGIHSGTGH